LIARLVTTEVETPDSLQELPDTLGPEAPAPDPPSPLRGYAWSRALTMVVAVVAGSRAGVGALAFLNRWDAPLFVAIARHGYADRVAGLTAHQVEGLRAFFPLYPLLVRAIACLFGVSELSAAVAVSVAAGAGAVALLYRIALRVTGEEAAGRAVLLFSFFPGAMVLSMPYSEGIMILLAAATLLALMEERWWLAGLTAALATASRASALGLVPACLWMAVRAYRRGAGWRPFVAPALAPAGIGTFFAFLWARTGDPLAYLNAEKAWGSGLGFGAPAGRLVLQWVHSPLSASPLAITATLSLVLAAVGAVLLLRRGWPPVLAVYSLSVLAISVACRVDGLRPRDVLTAFPLFLAAGHVLRGRWYRLAVALSATAMASSLLFHNLGGWYQP
jgi:hypothetical protein